MKSSRLRSCGQSNFEKTLKVSDFLLSSVTLWINGNRYEIEIPPVDVSFWAALIKSNPLSISVNVPEILNVQVCFPEFGLRLFSRTTIMQRISHEPRPNRASYCQTDHRVSKETPYGEFKKHIVEDVTWHLKGENGVRSVFFRLCAFNRFGPLCRRVSHKPGLNHARYR